MSCLFSVQDLGAFTRPGVVAKPTDHKPWPSPGVIVLFENGWRLSVQWSKGHYCSRRDLNLMSTLADDALATSTDAEIAAWVDRGTESTGMLSWSCGDTVAGWQPYAHVMALVDRIAAGELDPTIELPAFEEATVSE